MIKPVMAAAVLAAALTACGSRPEPAEPELKPGSFGNALSPEAEELVRLGVSYHDQGDYETAIGYYDAALELAPDHP
ncbi:MAG: tetratricopeptide repeat protein, partial [Spirochaetaceae bacterium]|nr:tetratricopeptide repeat protein [Spirochaetaceae bacterium]